MGDTERLYQIIKTGVENGTVFRVNCLDCLDRTNMIQYVIATRCLCAKLMPADDSTSHA